MRLLRFLPRRWWSIDCWKSWWSYVKWRMETWGVYHPDGKFNKENFWRMVKQFPSYYKWIGRMDSLKKVKQ